MFSGLANLMKSSLLHSLVFFLLRDFVKDTWRTSETLLDIALHLLYLIVSHCTAGSNGLEGKKLDSQYSSCSFDHVLYTTQDIFANASTPIVDSNGEHHSMVRSILRLSSLTE